MKTTKLKDEKLRSSALGAGKKVMYTFVQCTLYNVYCIMHIVQCILYNACCTMYIIQCTLHNVHCIMYIVLITYCTMYIVHCATYTVSKHGCFNNVQTVMIIIQVNKEMSLQKDYSFFLIAST